MLRYADEKCFSELKERNCLKKTFFKYVSNSSNRQPELNNTGLLNTLIKKASETKSRRFQIPVGTYLGTRQQLTSRRQRDVKIKFQEECIKPSTMYQSMN